MRDTTLKRLFDQAFYPLLRVGDGDAKFSVRRDEVRVGGVMAPPVLADFKQIDFSAFLPTGHVDGVNMYSQNKLDEAMVRGLADGEVISPDVLWPLTSCLAWVTGEEGGFQLYRAESIFPWQARGAVKYISPKMIKWQMYNMFNAAEKRVERDTILFSWLGGKWVISENGLIPPNKGDLAGYSNWVGLMQKIALRHRYEWAVEISISPSEPSLRFATDFTGIRELFRRREKDTSVDRRRALKTWITDHWRVDHHSPEDEIYVRKHFRGHQQFDWMGYNCYIHPSDFDIEKLGEFKSQRERMAEAGLTRRPRS